MEGSGVDFVGRGYPRTSADGKTVTLGPGKLFEVGWWPEKNFSLNASEADAAVSVGGKIAIEVEHVRSIFDGKLGYAELTGRSGADLIGSLTIPKALADIVGTDKPLKLSMVWDTATKLPLRIGLVLNPAITDAQVAAAFSASGMAIDMAGIYRRMNEPAIVGVGSSTPFQHDGDDQGAIYARMNAVQTPAVAGQGKPAVRVDPADVYARLNAGA